MNNKVQEFLNETFGEVRVIEQNKQIWFVASDVAKILEYRKSRDMTRNLDEDEKGTQSLLTLGGEQECLIINESGLYNAVLSITKRNKERYAKSRKFKKWITNTVIPAIRKDGAYINGEEDIDANNEEQETEFVLKAMTMLQNKVDRLKEENKELKPKAINWGKFLDSDGTYNFTQVSKMISTVAKEENKDIKISCIKLTNFLRNSGILSKQKSPDKIKDGKKKNGKYTNLPNKNYEDYFNVVSIKVNKDINKTQTRVKPSGVEYIYNLVKKKYQAQ